MRRFVVTRRDRHHRRCDSRYRSLADASAGGGGSIFDIRFPATNEGIAP